MVLCLVASGCAGRAHVQMVPLGMKRIEAQGPLIVEVRPDECYFWVGDDDRLCISMRDFSGSILGKPLQREFLLSFVVEGLPAAQSRDYRMDRNTARVKQRAGYSHLRAASTSGILAVWDYDADQLRGRFRFMVKAQTFSVLTGWTGNNALLYTGDFHAVRDERAGLAILARTEDGAMSRTAPKAP